MRFSVADFKEERCFAIQPAEEGVETLPFKMQGIARGLYFYHQFDRNCRDMK